MISDPLLATHEWLPRVYVLSPLFSPISIRDQMLRGRMLAERVIDAGQVSKWPLLVVGAGAGGATAAIYAATRGVRTRLVDQASAPFSLQRQVSSRWLDPTQYDWPLDHWEEKKFDWQGVSMPLEFHAESASQLALEWKTKLDQAVMAGPLVFDGETRLTELDPHKLFITATFDRALPRDYGAVIWAAGVGLENTNIVRPKQKDQPAVPQYQGPPFWSNDPLSKQNLGVTPGYDPVRVVIAGGGDGALQDFLRIVTGWDSAREIFKGCNIPPDLGRTLQSAEDRALRGWAWAEGNKRYQHAIHRELQDVHDTVARDALKDPNVLAALQKLTSNAPKVYLVHGCNHLEPFYGLNRFLATLILEYSRVNSLPNLVHRAGEAVVSIEPHPSDHHDCMTPGRSGLVARLEGNGNRVCHGKMHTLRIGPWSDCTKERPVEGSPLDANVVIVRYGIVPDTAPRVPLRNGRNPPAGIFGGRQLLPYHLSA